MAGRNSKIKRRISKAQRQLKVSYASTRHSSQTDNMTVRYSRCPALHLKGKWLEEAGFTTGQPVNIMIQHGQLIICPADS